METDKSERESFWDAETFAFVTDQTKPAMKWAISKLKKSGKKVYVVDLSEKPEPGSLKTVSELPEGLECAVLGVTKSEPADQISALKAKGINRIWIHWKTETEKAKETCKADGLECLTEHCPMLYLGSGFSIHGLHRVIAKIKGTY